MSRCIQMLASQQERPSVDHQENNYALSVSTSQTVGMSRNEITAPKRLICSKRKWSCNSSKNLRSEIVAPIILQNLIDNTDASKQSKTSSGETPELGFMMLETTRSSKNLKQTVKNEFRGIPWTGVYDAGNHLKLQKPPLHTGVMVENSQLGSKEARQRKDACKLTT